jgi:pyridoxal phosphate enzyme (YggS family)
MEPDGADLNESGLPTQEQEPDVQHSASDRDRIASNVREVLARINRAAARVGRQGSAIRLVAVTKTVPPERIRVAISAGVRLLGENWLQEALPKLAALRESDVEWHFIGRLQRRKVKAIVGAFALIQSVDSLELAAEIDRRAREAGVKQDVLLEINVGGEATKAGFSPDEAADAVTAFDALPHVVVRGLMAIPPPGPDAEASRPYFRTMRELARSLSSWSFRRVRMEELSMGTSGDFEVAIEEGATMVRVGTAIFGERHG